MFRSLRFCYFLTGSYRNVGNVALKRFISPIRVTSVPRPMHMVREVSFLLDTEINRAPSLDMNFCASMPYWSNFMAAAEDDIDWDECLARPEVPKEDGVNTYAIILLLCRNKKLFNHAKSFFKYLMEKGEITPGLLHLFCNFMLDYPEELKCCEDMINEIYLSVLHTDKISMKICSRVLLRSTKYSDVVFGSYKDLMADNDNHSAVILSLIEGKKIKKAFDLYASSKFRLFWIEKLFLDHFLQEAKRGIPNVPDICDFLNGVTMFNSDYTIPDDNLTVLEELFAILNHLDKDYFWIVSRKGTISSVCSNCKGKLKLVDVTQEEIDILIKDLEESVVIQESIFMKSNHEEWNRFCNFIKNENYNLVMDGLNVKYALNDYCKFEQLVSKIISAGITPFVLARLHFKRSLEYKLIQQKFPIFLTENLSDDDVFVLYAALKKGKGCYTLSNDKMSFCYNLLSSPDRISIYKRWQATHQCKLYSLKFVFPPHIVNGVQKCTDGEKDEFRYHYLANNNPAPSTLICISRIKKGREGCRRRGVPSSA